METTPWDQYWVKLEAATTGGNMPDVVTMHSSESYKYMSQNALMGLDDVIKENDIDMGNFTEGIADFYTLEDELYAIPKDASVVGHGTTKNYLIMQVSIIQMKHGHGKHSDKLQLI